MHVTLSAVCLVGTLATSVPMQEGGRTRGAYLGTYGSVTESECNVELELLDGKKARIVEVCRREDGSRQDMSQATPATWSFAGDRVIVEYDDQRDVLEYDPTLSYGSFGKRGSGPGLKLLEHLGSNSRLAGFGHLWKRPLAEREDVLGPLGIPHLPISRSIEAPGILGTPVMGWGSYPDVDAAAKVAQLLQDDGAHGGRQLLSRTRVREAMSGHGGNHVMMLPSGVSVVRFMDAGDYEVSHATRAAEMHRSSCP